MRNPPSPNLRAAETTISVDRKFNLLVSLFGTILTWEDQSLTQVYSKAPPTAAQQLCSWTDGLREEFRGVSHFLRPLERCALLPSYLGHLVRSVCYIFAYSPPITLNLHFWSLNHVCRTHGPCDGSSSRVPENCCECQLFVGEYRVLAGGVSVKTRAHRVLQSAPRG